MRELVDILNSGTELNDSQLELAASQLLDENEEVNLKTEFLKSLANKERLLLKSQVLSAVFSSMQLIQNSLLMIVRAQPLMFVALEVINLIFLIFQLPLSLYSLPVVQQS